MATAFLLTVLTVSVIAAALVAAPLRRGSPRTWLAVMAAVPVLALALYQMLGTPEALDPAKRSPSLPEGAAVDPAQFAQALAELRAELARNPEQPEGWVLLARALAAQGDHAGARDAYATALELVPDEPALMVELAQAGARAHPRNLFEDQALALLERAIALQPTNQRARWFLGVAQRQRGLDAQAAATWEALLPLVDPSTAASLEPQIAEARAAAGLPARDFAAPAPDVGGVASAPAAGGPESGLRVRVRLAEGLAATAGDQGTVFVTARDPDGPPMPVAAERHPLAALPLDIVLDDADGPMPTRRLSELDRVLVSARIAKGGSVERSADDIESAAIMVSLPSDGTVDLVLGAE